MRHPARRRLHKRQHLHILPPRRRRTRWCIVVLVLVLVLVLRMLEVMALSWSLRDRRVRLRYWRMWLPTQHMGLRVDVR